MRLLYLGSNINLSGTCSLLVCGRFRLSLTWSARNHPLKRDSLLHCWLYRADFKQNAHPGLISDDSCTHRTLERSSTNRQFAFKPFQNPLRTMIIPTKKTAYYGYNKLFRRILNERIDNRCWW
jgi:hypothetical protein